MATYIFGWCQERSGGAVDSHDGYALLRFLVQSCGIVCAGVLLYSLGPFLGAAYSVSVWRVVKGYQLACCHEGERLATPRVSLTARSFVGCAVTLCWRGRLNRIVAAYPQRLPFVRFFDKVRENQ